MHSNSKLIFDQHVRPLLCGGLWVLEVGPDDFPSTYQKLAGNSALEWQTLDIRDDARLTFPKSDQYAFPVSDAAYDVVLSGQVVEHVRKPWLWLQELTRITKPGGLVITIAPVSWVYHEDPIDCWRIYPEGMKALYEEAGLEVELCEWGSLESPGQRRYLPGVSAEFQRERSGFQRWLLRKLRVPVERAYDTVAIGRKPGVGSAG